MSPDRTGSYPARSSARVSGGCPVCGSGPGTGPSCSTRCNPRGDGGWLRGTSPGGTVRWSVTSSADRPRPPRRVPYGRAPYVRRGARREAGSGDARTLALRVIRRVTEQGAYSNLALAAELRRSTLTERDRRFATDLVYGTLRATLRLDAMIASASERPVSHVDEETLAVLRLGAYQVRE